MVVVDVVVDFIVDDVVVVVVVDWINVELSLTSTYTIKIHTR